MDRKWVGERVIHTIYRWNVEAFHLLHTVSEDEGDTTYEWPE